MLIFILIFVVLVAVWLVRPVGTAIKRETMLKREQRQVTTIRQDVGTLRFFRRHRWLVRGVHTGPIARRALRLARAEIRWTRRELAETRAALRPPAPIVSYVSAWLCIHRHEGSWSANTGNGYYGGLQMDLAFQRAYGADLLARKGTANNWTPAEQMMVAERGHKSGRGFSPWPNTARMCGLL